jgi:hypothetical protein
MPVSTGARLARSEGSVLVIAAVWMGVGLLFTSFVIDVGNWFEHQRHLQTQADAAAFAAGSGFTGCFGGGAGKSAVFTNASNYAGVSGIDEASGQVYPAPLTDPDTGGPVNEQVGGANQGAVTAWYQSTTYPPGPAGTVREPAAETDFTDGEDPCAAPNIFDVKLTEGGLPLFFGTSLPAIFGDHSIIPPINVHAHARVQLFASAADVPSIPLAPTDTDFTQTTATFINGAGTELSGCTGAALVAGTTCTFSLGSAGCTAAQSLTVRCGSVTVPLPANSLVFMRVGLGTSAGTCAGTLFTSTYQCFDNVATGTGLYAIRGTGAPPQTGAYEVTPIATCQSLGSPFFSPIDMTSGSCGGTLQAWIDDGVAATTTVSASDNTSNNVALTRCTAAALVSCHDTTNGRNAWLWSTASGAFNLSSTQGADPVALTSGTGRNKVTLGTQQFYGGGNTDNSGPIQFVRASNASGTVTSLPAGSNTFTVTVGYSTYTVQSPCGSGIGATYKCATDPTIVLRSKFANSSNTMAIDCGGGTLRDQITNGCSDEYQLHPGPPYTPVCDTVTPPDCAQTNGIGQGQKAGQVRQAMQTRWGGTCNNYPNYGTDTSDPRLVLILLTDSSAWNGGSGAGVTVPVVRFAAFYITGWDGGTGGTGSCGNEPFPGPGTSQLADIWGHFVKYVDTLGTPGSTACDPTSPTPCVPSLVK